MLDLLLTLISAMSISSVQSCMNCSRAASSPSDQNACREGLMGLRIRKELNRHGAAVFNEA